MKRANRVTVNDPQSLARALGLSPTDAIQIQIRRRLNEKIIAAVVECGLTHAQVAKAAVTSRSRLTAILNRNTAHVSTDLLLRILAALGYRARITFSRKNRAA
jgi:predicted XRE-type DNA-binding protein